ncbi:putative pyridine nucleotide-disulfide oxidoreductase [Gonapodya prolifera JEL478]|uniref:Putative pyridine nucleotide-disulfide oxidoreductase n=1 Tax=Gonapodya prolifera (strain JEL478) TaxID=1344416 RepID=A0A139AVH1_GONPJ|nr:putative pyridine nucleotide-disulfide oxidoreductase [Gonapodya prolifera JEL478]|eukprot:KXS20475.1 putative pyridine nucleotide-disulfide oxidoreductase [Gonapodya prolifera JEL478]
MFEKGPYISFSNCGLPYYIGGLVENRDKLFLSDPASLAARYNINARTSCEVFSIDRAAKSLVVKDLTQNQDVEQHYDKLILCPGATAIVPPILGARAANVFTLKTVPDADAILSWLRHLPDAASGKNRVVVVGAGFIGLEAAEQLFRGGADVTVVEKTDQVLPVFDRDMAAFVSNNLVSKGVNVVLDDGVEEVFTEKLGQSEVAKEIKLTSGKALPCDLVILSIGVRPETQLASECGLQLSPTKGIIVDEYCRTSDPNIYACGDATDIVNLVTGNRQQFALAGPANRMGRVAGSNAASTDHATFRGALGTCIVECLGVAAGMTGITEKACKRDGIPYNVAVVHQQHHTGVYPGANMMHIKTLSDSSTGRLLGAQIVGGPHGVDKRIDVFATALHARMTVDDVEELDLAYAPQFASAKDPVHMAAFVAANQHAGLVNEMPLPDVLARIASVPQSDRPSQFQLLDVRGKDEWGRDGVPDVPGCSWIHVPVNSLRAYLDSTKCSLDPRKETYVLCQSGLRSYLAARVLVGRGFTTVWNVRGGFMMVPGEKRRAEVDG